MANIRSVLGKFNKTMGGITFTNWKGQNVVKQKVPDTNSSQSPAQIAQRTKFAALAKLSGIAGAAIRIGMKMSATDRTEQNVFQSVNAPAVTLDNAGQPVIAWNSLQFSQGKVPTATGEYANVNEPAKQVSVHWNDNSNGIDALGTDVAVVVVVNQTEGLAVVSIGGATRADKTIVVPVIPFNKLQAEYASVYIFFKRATSTECSPTDIVPVMI